MNRDEWIQRVERHLYHYTLPMGWGIDDMPDVPWLAWYDQRVPAAQAARRAIRAMKERDLLID